MRSIKIAFLLASVIAVFVANQAFAFTVSTTTRHSPQWPLVGRPSLLTTTVQGVDANEGDHADRGHKNIFATAVQKFRNRPGTYITIPIVAAVVGWFTNWLAVQMIFYPIKYWGLPIYVRDEMPLGFLGWQGIIPCKTVTMTTSIVNIVTQQLLSIPEVFSRLDPNAVAKLLAPEIPAITQEIIRDICPRWLSFVPAALYNGFDSATQNIIQTLNVGFVKDLTVAIQGNAEQIFSVKNCVMSQMLNDRSKLGELFQICGRDELKFLTDSGLWFGFLLGLIQMTVALFYDNPWSLSIGGGIVGFATNWLALKWIFEPVNPTKIGPWLLQGQFLRRQAAVAAEFSQYFSETVLSPPQIWQSILSDPATRPLFAKLFAEQFQSFVTQISSGLRVAVEPETLQRLTDRALAKLPSHLPVIFPYMTKALDLQKTLETSMNSMTSAQFERVLHPIFEQDELTLILAGMVLGFAAGLIQQGLETGAIRIPSLRQIVDLFKSLGRRMRRRLGRIPNDKSKQE
jgi:uncharacterized membrane protein YheB (UPF0754 family)